MFSIENVFLYLPAACTLLAYSIENIQRVLSFGTNKTCFLSKVLLRNITAHQLAAVAGAIPLVILQ